MRHTREVRFLRPGGAAELVGVTVATINRWAKSGVIPPFAFIRVGTEFRFDRDMLALLASTGQLATTPKGAGA